MAAVETIDLSIQLPPSDRLRGSNLQQFHPQTDFLAHLLSSSHDNAIGFITHQFSETHDAEIKENLLQRSTIMKVFAPFFIRQLQESLPLSALKDQSVDMAANKLRESGQLSVESVVQKQLGVLPENNAFSSKCTNGFFPWSAKWIIQAALLKDLTLEEFHQIIPQEIPPLWMFGKK